MTPITRPLVITLVAVLAVGCSSPAATPTVDDWFDAASVAIAEHPPESDVMQIDPSAPCGLVDELDIDGTPPELFGAGTAMFGASGTRYQCAWSGDQNGSANVRLEVVRIDSEADFAAYAELVPTRVGNTTVATDLGDVEVASFRPGGAQRPVVTSVLVSEDQHGGIQLVVELLGNQDWTPRQHAELLARTVADGT